jgi:hypothetical protein
VIDDHTPSDLVARVRAQLAEWGLEESAEAAAALDIARRLTAPNLAASPAALLHAQLRSQLVDLRKLAPPAVVNDEVSDLRAEREKRRKAAGG